MIVFTTRELAQLAVAYSRSTGITLGGVGDRALGKGNHNIFARLLKGRDCTVGKAARASAWFLANWPEGEAWPAGVERPDGPPPQKRRQTPARPSAREVAP
jgi:hypothetical protein